MLDRSPEAVVKYMEFLQRGQNENPGPKKSQGGTSCQQSPISSLTNHALSLLYELLTL
jgi:hypothetical protein